MVLNFFKKKNKLDFNEVEKEKRKKGLILTIQVIDDLLDSLKIILNRDIEEIDEFKEDIKKDIVIFNEVISRVDIIASSYSGKKKNVFLEVRNYLINMKNLLEDIFKSNSNKKKIFLLLKNNLKKYYIVEKELVNLVNKE